MLNQRLIKWVIIGKSFDFASLRNPVDRLYQLRTLFASRLIIFIDRVVILIKRVVFEWLLKLTYANIEELLEVI